MEELTFAQLKAYNKLVDYGVAEGITLEMIGRVGGSEIRGFEDWYFVLALEIFEQKAKIKNAGTLVNWFLKKKVFEQGDMFARIMERLQEKKKALQQQDIQAWDNRQMAKEMTAEEFRKKTQMNS